MDTNRKTPTLADLEELYSQGPTGIADALLALSEAGYNPTQCVDILDLFQAASVKDSDAPVLWRMLQASNERCHNLVECNPLFASIRSLGSHVEEFLSDIGELAETLLPYLLHEPDVPSDQDLEAIASACCVALYDVMPDFEAGLKDAIVTLILLRDFISPAPMGQKEAEQCRVNGVEQEWTLSSDGQTQEGMCGKSGGAPDVTKCGQSSLGDFLDPPYDDPDCQDPDDFDPDEYEPPDPLYHRFGGASLWTNFNRR